MPTKVLLDTDIGSDIDDAVALAYLLAQPECDLLGITTVTGEPVKRASMASALCRVAEREVPIFPGDAQPLQIAQRQPEAKQAAALVNWSHETDFPEGKAIEFLAQTIEANPNEVILLTIGPLTNIANLFQAYPQVPGLLKGLVIMGGAFRGGFMADNKAEWNLLLDPLAAEIVYGARARLHRSIGLDVTTQVTMPANEVREQFQTRLLKPVLDFAEIWFQNVDKIVFHDPLAAATIFDETICTYETGTVRIDMDEHPGLSVFTAGGVDAPHEVAFGVDAPGFLKHFFGVSQAFEQG